MTLTALQAAGVFRFVFTTTVFFVRCRLCSKQQPTAVLVLVVSNLVVSSHELVSCGNSGNSDAIVEWITAAMLV